MMDVILWLTPPWAVPLWCGAAALALDGWLDHRASRRNRDPSA